jgi:hypothetical protein
MMYAVFPYLVYSKRGASYEGFRILHSSLTAMFIYLEIILRICLTVQFGLDVTL